jgi:hypothetical protein
VLTGQRVVSGPHCIGGEGGNIFFVLVCRGVGDSVSVCWCACVWDLRSRRVSVSVCRCVGELVCRCVGVSVIVCRSVGVISAQMLRSNSPL